MASLPLLPLDVWTSQITQASIPANQNALRVEVLNGAVRYFANDTDSTLTEGDIYIVDASPTGDFASFTSGNLVIYKEGVFYEFEPNLYLVKHLQTDDTNYIYKETGWEEYSSGGGATSLKLEALTGYIKSFANDTDSTLAEGDIYIVDTAPTGDFAGFTPGNLVIYKDGEFTQFEPPLYFSKDVTYYGQLWTYTGSGVWLDLQARINNTYRRSISAVFDGGGVELVPGAYTFIHLPYACYIDEVYLLADAVGNAELEIEHCTYADFPTFDVITGTGNPILTIQQKNMQNITPTWTKTEFNENDVLKVTLLSCDGITKLNMMIKAYTYTIDT